MGHAPVTKLPPAGPGAAPAAAAAANGAAAPAAVPFAGPAAARAAAADGAAPERASAAGTYGHALSARPEPAARGATEGAGALDAQALPRLTGLGSVGLGLAARPVGARLSGNVRLEADAVARPCGAGADPNPDPAAAAQQHAWGGGAAQALDPPPDPALARLPPVPLGAAQAAAGAAGTAAANSRLGLGHAPDVLDPMQLSVRSDAASLKPAQEPRQARCTAQRPADGSAPEAAAASGAGEPPLGGASPLGRERSASLPVSVAALAPAFSADAEQQLGASAHAAPAADSGTDMAGGTGRGGHALESPAAPRGAPAGSPRVSSPSAAPAIPSGSAAGASGSGGSGGGGGAADDHGSPEKQFRAVVDLAAPFSHAELGEPPSLSGAARRSTSEEEERIAQAGTQIALLCGVLWGTLCTWSYGHGHVQAPHSPAHDGRS